MNTGIDTGVKISPAELAQNIDSYCIERLHDEDAVSGKAPRAYASSNNKKQHAIQLCSSINLVSGLDISGGSYKNIKNCGFNSSDNQKFSTCMNNPNIEGCVGEAIL